MDINNKPEVKEPEKTEVCELNDDDLDGVNGGSFAQPAPTPAPPGSNDIGF